MGRTVLEIGAPAVALLIGVAFFANPWTRNEVRFGYLSTGITTSLDYNPQKVKLLVGHRGGNSTDNLVKTNQANTPQQDDNFWAELDARMISSLDGRKREWWIFHGDIVGPLSIDLSRALWQPGRLGSSFDEIASLARSLHQSLFVDINKSWVNRPTLGDLLSLQTKLQKLGVPYAFTSTSWDSLDVLSGQRFYTIKSEKNLKYFIAEQETILIPKRTAVTLKGKLATEANVQALLKAGVSDICAFVINKPQEMKTLVGNGVNCIITDNLSLRKRP